LAWLGLGPARVPPAHRTAGRPTRTRSGLEREAREPPAVRHRLADRRRALLARAGEEHLRDAPDNAIVLPSGRRRARGRVRARDGVTTVRALTGTPLPGVVTRRHVLRLPHRLRDSTDVLELGHLRFHVIVRSDVTAFACVISRADAARFPRHRFLAVDAPGASRHASRPYDPRGTSPSRRSSAP